jgi:hypothetical protein
VAIVKVDDQTIDTAFIQEYLKRPANDPVRLAAEKWQQEQAAKTRKRQPKGKTTVAGVAVESRDIKPFGTAVDPLSAKKKTAAEQKKANDKARAAGAALPFPEAASATVEQTGVPGAGRGTTSLPQGPGLGGRDVIPTKPTGPGRPAGTTRTTTTTQPTGEVTPTGGTGGKTPKAPAGTVTTTKDKQQLGKDTLITAGINQAVVQYMKENYPQDWAKIKELRDLAIQDGTISDAEKNRITNAFKTTEYFKKAATEKNRTTIGAYFIANGLDTASNAALIDRLTNDVFVSGVNTLEQAQAQIRRTAVDRLGLNSPDVDPSKKKIAQAMLDGGQTFLTAAQDYIAQYASLMDIPVNQFDPLEDAGFLSAFNAATSLDDFRVKAKSSPTYANSRVGRQEVDSTKLRLQQLTRNLGLGYNPQRLEEQALNVISGKETFEQLEYSLRSIAGEAFPAFKDRILAGETITSIASPYVSSMSRILEMPDSSIDISDPNNEIRKALIGNGTNPKPLWQFEQDLFKDARWQYTSNARDTMDRVGMDILKRFGVMG